MNGRYMSILRKILRVPARLLFPFFLFSASLLAGGEKDLTPLPPDIQKEYSQTEPRAIFSDPVRVSPPPLPMEEEDLLSPLIPPELINTEGSDSKG